MLPCEWGDCAMKKRETTNLQGLYQKILEESVMSLSFVASSLLRSPCVPYAICMVSCIDMSGLHRKNEGLFLGFSIPCSPCEPLFREQQQGDRLSHFFLLRFLALNLHQTPISLRFFPLSCCRNPLNWIKISLYLWIEQDEQNDLSFV